MKFLINYFKKSDLFLTLSAFLLSMIGLISMYSYSVSRGDFLIFKKQIIFLIIAFFVMTIVSFFDWRAFKENSYLILALYFIFIVLLIGLFFFAPEIKGSQRWYRLGPVSFDPLEFGKIVLIILLAKYFSMRHVEMYKLQHILLSGFYILVPSVIVFFQPDMGSAMILVSLWVGVLFISGIKLKHFLILFLCGIITLALGWNFFLRDYQKDRVLSFISPESDPLGSGWSQIQSKIAIGSGGFWGQGITSGSQLQHGFLSEPHTDFIFAAIAEEMGFLGIMILFFFFFFLIWRIIRIIFYSRSNFPRLFASGFLIVLISQFIINIGMNLGVLPVVGLPLPFVSYGGSSLIFLFLGIGILQSIKINP